MISKIKAYLERLLLETMENLTLIQSDVAHTSVPDHSMDCALFAIVLHYVKEKMSFFSDIMRILRDTAGLIVDIDWQKWEMNNGRPLEITLSKGQARKFLKESGLTIVRQINALPYHDGFVCTWGGNL